MEQGIWYDRFTEILAKRFPKKKQLVEALMELLSLEREAAYRRLRKDVLFSIHEIVIIATAWNISLDEIASVDFGKISFQMQLMNYLDPSKEEVEFLQQFIKSIKMLNNFPSTVFMDICNKLPRQFEAGYEYLNKFSLFQWMYQYRSDVEAIPFGKINISETKHKLTLDYYKAIKQVPNSNFIFDQRIFLCLINDVQYFFSIYLITKEEKELIKNDLFSLIDYLEEVANKGCYPETHNNVNIFISELKVETGYSYTITPDINICYIHVFDKLEIYSLNSEMVNHFITWMQLKKRASIKISEVDEKSRIDFFSKQRQIVESL